MGILIDVLKDIFTKRVPAQSAIQKSYESTIARNKVLNVGGGSKRTKIPEYFADWQHDLLDIDPRGNPDIVCDARELLELPAGQYEAIYCSHNLEHYYRHDGLSVLKGFVHILKEDGFAEVRVPDIAQVINAVFDRQLDLDDELYVSAAGPITAHDVIYGLQSEIVNSGQDFYAHKTGFTTKSLPKLLEDAGFGSVFLQNDEFLAIHALAFKKRPTAQQYKMFQKTWNLLGGV